EIFEQFPGPVIDSFDIRENPEHMLKKLCGTIGLDWDPGMLFWPAGPKPFDGVWASHWYKSVHDSKGFAGKEGAMPALIGESAALLEQALPFYEQLEAKKL
ncbi:MAG: HAD family hydrolase, partial [Boseongicola sp.]|nr:HAD family hydrolase [Boseongicola sp.]